MSEENEALVRAAYVALGRGDLSALLEFVHPDLEWTYLDPGMENPEPQTCHGRGQLEWAVAHQARQGLASEMEQITSHGDQVLVIMHTPGLDQRRAWAGRDRNYMVVTVRGGQIVTMRAFRNAEEARAFTGLPAAGR
jgi:ketosteroid isomerase-like protein